MQPLIKAPLAHTGPVPVSPWTFPPQLVLLSFESGSVILDQRVQRAPECWWCKHSIQRLPHCSPLSQTLPGVWGGTGSTIAAVPHPEDCRLPDERCYWQGTAACLIRCRGLRLMTWDTVGRRSGKCWPSHCGGMQLSCGEWWIGSVWPGEQTQGLLLPCYCALFVEGHVASGEYRWVNIYPVNASGSVISDRLIVYCESCNFISLCVHCAGSTVSLSVAN